MTESYHNPCSPPDENSEEALAFPVWDDPSGDAAQPCDPFLSPTHEAQEAASAKDDMDSLPIGEREATSVSFDELETRLMALQQELLAQGIPVVILFEGWGAAGKGTMLGELLKGLDPRGYKVYTAGKPSPEESHFPLSRRFWVRMPAAGNISLFVGSWYRDISSVCPLALDTRIQKRYAQIVQMESQLIASGALIIKFFINISKKEQKKRLKALESKKSTRWRVTQEDWEQNRRYDEMLKLYNGMMAHTHFDGALWHVLRGEDRRACKEQMYGIVLDAFEKAIAERKEGERLWDTPILDRVPAIPIEPIEALSAFQPHQSLAEDYKLQLQRAQKKLRRLHSELYRKQIPVALCFEGWDAAGKGGAIRRLTGALDPRGFEVVPISAPTPVEKSHHHLWRFWKTLPKDGHITIFDRTWYGRVLVERVEGFCTENEWQRAYEEINQFERELTSRGTVLRKFWLQIDKDEQLARFQARQSDPEKQWKITEDDWRNREKWPEYEASVNEMLARTHTQHAPWIVVEANNKKYARLKVLNAVIDAIEQALKERGK